MTDVASTATGPMRVPAAAALPAAAVILVAACLLSLAVGPVWIPPARVAEILGNAAAGHSSVGLRDAVIVLDVRLPRTVLAMLVGSATAVAGGVMQGLFRNPLADPSLVGVSSGAALAAALWFVFGAGSISATLGTLGLPLAAFGGGLAAALLLNFLSARKGRTSVVTMLLAGIALTGLAGAAIGFLVFIASDQQLRDFTFWTLGSLGGATWTKVAMTLPFVIALGIVVPFIARGLDALALGESAAFHSGISVEALKRASIFAVAGAIGASVAVTGVIGFFGLTVPHLVRLTCGPGHRLLLPVTALSGGALLAIADVVARIAAAPAEIPLGVITAAIGAPLMIWLLFRRPPAELA